MPIEWVTNGDMFVQPYDARVNAVNCVGVMGKSLAAEFKRRYPQMFHWYAGICRGGHLRPGGYLAWTNNDDGSHVINCATKDGWRDPSRYEWVESCLAGVRREVQYLGVRSVAVPALGCGLGGLAWSRVRPMVVDALGTWPGRAVVFEP